MIFSNNVVINSLSRFSVPFLVISVLHSARCMSLLIIMDTDTLHAQKCHTLLKIRNKNENHDIERSGPSFSDVPEWLQEFRVNLMDDKVLNTETYTLGNVLDHVCVHVHTHVPSTRSKPSGCPGDLSPRLVDPF